LTKYFLKISAKLATIVQKKWLFHLVPAHFCRIRIFWLYQWSAFNQYSTTIYNYKQKISTVVAKWSPHWVRSTQADEINLKVQVKYPWIVCGTSLCIRIQKACTFTITESNITQFYIL